MIPTLATRYPGADTRSKHFRQIVVDDVLAVSAPTEAVSILTEAIRKAFTPDTAKMIYRAIGAAAEDRQ